jgi:hypothetical protein
MCNHRLTPALVATAAAVAIAMLKRRVARHNQNEPVLIQIAALQSLLSEGAKERDQIALLLAGQFRAEHQIEELDRIIESQQAPIVQVGRLILDAAQREGLDGSVAGGIHVVDRHRLEEALGLEIVRSAV